MVDPAPLWGFVALAVVVSVAPGSDMILLIRSAMTGGRARGFAAFAGIHTGNLVLTTLAAAGVGAVVSRVEWIMLAIQLLGGAYLLWMGGAAARQAFREARLLRQHREAEEPEVVPVGGGLAQAYRQGLVTNLTNPKLLVFYASIFPQFMGTATSPFLQMELLAAVFIGIALVWEALVVVLAGSMQKLAAHPAFALVLEALCALAFFGLGGFVLLEAVQALAG